MVTIEQLKKQIAGERAKVVKVRERERLAIEKSDLQKELKILQRGPTTKTSIKLLRRSGRGLRVIGKKVAKAAKRQAERIRNQQLRDAETIRKSQTGGRSRRVKTVTIIKRKGKKPKRVVSFKKVKIKSLKKRRAESDFGGGVFDGLPELGI